MSFLRWLNGLNRGLDRALAAKDAVDTILNSAHAGRSVTEPIKQALEYVKGLRNEGTTEGETAETPQASREE